LRWRSGSEGGGVERQRIGRGLSRCQAIDLKSTPTGKGELSTGGRIASRTGRWWNSLFGRLSVEWSDEQSQFRCSTNRRSACTKIERQVGSWRRSLDAAGKAILGSLHRAASAAEANYQQALEMTDQLSAGLRAAEDRIRELEAKVRHHQDRADRAEKWLYQVSVEIEQKFFGREDGRPSQPPPPQALFRNQRQ
jgi:hypothetical protein